MFLNATRDLLDHIADHPSLDKDEKIMMLAKMQALVDAHFDAVHDTIKQVLGSIQIGKTSTTVETVETPTTVKTP